MIRSLANAFVSVLAAMLLVTVAHAQSEPKKSPFGMANPQAVEQSAAQPSATAPEHAGLRMRVWSWVLGMQARLNRDMAGAVRDLKAAGSVHAAGALALIAFFYGVFHAAGPGHGKAVISSYVLANERTVRRGIVLSFLAALIQAISAIVIVGVLAILLNATSLTIKATETWIETASWALVAAIGGWMLYTQVGKLVAGGADGAAHGHAAHDHDHACCEGQHDDNHAPHGHDACCGHAHMPAPKDLEGELGWRKALAIAGSVGIRPCTGAIIVLIFAMSQGLLWAGVLATFAMAIGTAITTSSLAAIAVGSKELATRFAGPESRTAEHLGTAAGLTGSTLVLLMGLAFFAASLKGAAPF